GRSVRAAANQLGWPQGTVGTRLARGRALLSARLTRRGVSCPCGVLAAVLGGTATAAVPRALVAATVRAAGACGAAVGPQVSAVLEGGSGMRVSHGVKAVLVAAACVGLAALALPGPASPAAPVPRQETDPVKLELARLQGTWRLVAFEHRGEKTAADEV